MEQPQPASAAPAAPDASGPRLFGGRYREQRLLQRGTVLTTLYGIDERGGDPVVIKTIAADRITAGVRMRLMHEAEILRRIDNPLLAPLLDVGQDEGLFFLVCRYQAGITLEALLRERRLTVRETLAVGCCVLAALHEAHERRVLHRDVKPANIILPQGDPLGGVVLVDFGLAHSSQLEIGVSDPPLETARYLSPEQSGVLDVDVAAYSDLYATGLVLFECLAGRPPFDGQSISELLRQHASLPAPELRQLVLSVPRALDELIQRLLRKDPRDRYQTAAAVLADLSAITSAVAEGAAEPVVVLGLHDHRQTLTEPAFVGRKKELEALQQQIRKAAAGRGGLVLLEAESGGGKTRLLGEWAMGCGQQEVWVLRGQALDQIAQQPFQVLEGIADEIVTACRSDPQRAAHIRAVAGDRLEAVGPVLPRLAEALGITVAQTLGPEVFGEARTVDALVTFLTALGSANRPALVILDDCQWADEPTLKLFRAWQSRRKTERGTPCYTVIVAAFRSEEVRAGHVLRSLTPGLHLHLAPFDEADVRRLAESMAGRLPEEAVAILTRLSDGSPFMASAVLRGMVESKALIAGAKGWRVERSAMDDVRASRHAAEVLARRIALLPRVAIDLLRVAAVLGKEFELTQAANLAGLLPGHAVVALQQAQSRHLVWTRPSDEKCLFVHDKVRDACLALLSVAERKELHLRAAAIFEQQTPLPIFDLAYHFSAADEHVRAFPYALEAAEHARARHSLEIAEQNYRIALVGAGSAEMRLCYRVAVGLGDVLLLRGDYTRAWQMFEAAVYIAHDMEDGRLAKAQVEGKLGEVAFKRGDMQQAAAAYQRALQLLDRYVPTGGLTLRLLVLWEAFVQVLHSWFPRWFLARRKPPEAEREFLAIRLYGRLAYVYWFAKGLDWSFWAHLREMNLAERYPPTPELAQAYSNHAPGMSVIPFPRRGIAYAEKSLAIRRAQLDLWGQGQSLHFYGLVLYTASRFPECIARCREAVQLLERTGDRWEVNIARHQIAASLFRLGDLRGAIEEAQRIRRSAVELGDEQAAGFCLDVWARASGGKVPWDIIQQELSRPSVDVQRTAQVLIAKAVCRMRQGRSGEAVEVLQDARRRVAQVGMRNVFVAPLLPLLTTALRQAYEETSSTAAAERQRLLRRALATARKASRIAFFFRNELPHVLRERGLLAAMTGHPRRARRLLLKSLAVSQRQEAQYEAAQTQICLGRLGHEQGWADADQFLTVGEEWVGRLESEAREAVPSAEDSAAGPRPPTLNLVDRFDTVLEVGRQIASALQREQIFQAVHQAAVKLLRCERCAVWSLSGNPGDPELSSVCGRGGAYHRALVRQALRERRTVAQSDTGGEESSSSGEMRSALCAPLQLRHETVAVLYASHAQLPGLFGETELRLADFIATIAGAALENAENFAQLQQLTQILEQRVQERTADLEQRSRELARSNAELEQFAYVVSHDLQEPLRTVLSYCQLLQSRYGDQLEERATEFVALAVEGAQRMKELINDLLIYSRVDSRGRPLAPTDCETVLRLALANLQTAIEECQATITHDALPAVTGDGTQLVQVFQNLIGNALKFRGPRRPEIHVGVERRDQEWMFSVRDNGIGIKVEDRDRIFLIFHRLHPREEYEGTGIGLAVCKKTIERHGGRIWVESEVGRGTVFYFTLPVVDGRSSDKADGV